MKMDRIKKLSLVEFGRKLWVLNKQMAKNKSRQKQSLDVLYTANSKVVCKNGNKNK